MNNPSSAQRRILPRLSTCNVGTPQYTAGRCLAASRSLRVWDDRQALSISSEVSELRRCVTSNLIGLQKLGRALQGALDCAVTLGTNALEKSSLPELQKIQKRQQLKVRMEPDRVKRKRMVLGGIHDEDGGAILDPAAVSIAIASEWSATFAERGLEEGGLCRCFLALSRNGAGRMEWSWPHSKLCDVASCMPQSAPGPDGWMCAFWAPAPDETLRCLETVANVAMRGVPLP